MTPLQECIADMLAASAEVDKANGTREYNITLVSLALIARHFLREHAEALMETA